jgi:hypothetical protein
MFSV